MWHKHFFITVFLIFLFGVPGAQEIYKPKYLGSSQGLSNNSVRAIFQDSRGFMWFGTYDGLNRYDGYEFKILDQRFCVSAA
ncbi:two-component regulator propeller domain-containing protein [Niabella aquatica]